MKLVFYMLKRFFYTFLGLLAFFVLIFSLADFLMNVWNYISHGVAMKDIGLIMLYYIPKTVWYSVPVAVLCSTAYMLSDFYAKNELLAIFASGISLFKFTFPLLVVSLGLSFGLFFFEDKVVVDSYAKKMELQATVLKKETELNSDNVVILSDGGKVVYKADFFDNALSKLFTLYVIFRDDNNELESIIYADNATWNNDHWSLNNSVEYIYNEQEIVRKSVEKKYIDRMTEPPETFRNNTVSVEEVTVNQAKQYIEHLEKAGLPSAEAKSQYYKKFSFPFSVFLVVFLAIGLSGKTRKNVLLVSIALCITAVVLFYVIQMVTMLMAKFQVVPPLFGAWFPVVFFVFVSIVLLKYAKT